MFYSLTAQKLSHDLDAITAFNTSDVPAGVDVNLFEDAKRVINARLNSRVKRTLAISHRDCEILFDSAERCSRDRAELNVAKAQKRREAREARELMLAAQ